mgnify:CR=1 FL=1
MNELKINISIVIITYNESNCIENALKSVYYDFSEIIILDSFSTDSTIDICKKYTDKIFYRKFDNFCNQRNYAINKITFKNKYIFFIDSDEIVSKELINELKNINLFEFDAYKVKRKFYWYGKWIKYGGYYPLYLMRIGNKSKIYYQGIVNEHMTIKNGKTYILNNHVSDFFDKPFKAWINKHILYSKLEAEKHFEKNASFTENYKNWQKLPLLIRPTFLFIYRYFFKQGFRLGISGFIYIFFHTFIYRTYIDFLILRILISKYFKLS